MLEFKVDTMHLLVWGGGLGLYVNVRQIVIIYEGVDLEGHLLLIVLDDRVSCNRHLVVMWFVLEMIVETDRRLENNQIELQIALVRMLAVDDSRTLESILDLDRFVIVVSKHRRSLQIDNTACLGLDQYVVRVIEFDVTQLL